MSRFTILLGGDLQPTPELEARIAGTRVIAADSGIRHAAALGLTPELWVGDFDSVTAETIAANAGIERDVHPADKDFTDGELAVACALERGATALVLVGAFGGARADHAHLHLAMILRLARQGVEVIASDGVQEATPLLPGEYGYDYDDGTLFSIMAFSHLSGLTVKGAKWPLDTVEVPFGSSLTISNEVRGTLSVALREGSALLLVHLHNPEKI